LPLVEHQQRIYASRVDGPRRRQRRVVGWLLIAFLVLVPWLRVGGMPAVRIDIPARRLLLLGHIFTPQDTWILALLGLAFALSLFLFTALLGRIWCGWACPQTVWLEWVFRPLERLIEGPAHRARRRDSKHSRGWLSRKVAKHAVFVFVSLVVTAVFMSWFVGGPELLRGEIGRPGLTVAALLAVGFFLDFAWFREQMCHYACPYARIQGVLMAERSLLVAYDAHRGEPRRKGKSPEGGDCVDCGLCYSVCPSGIDIREGDQLQCIACGACADACDSVMIKLGRPTRLVRYTTHRDAPASDGEWKPHFGLRPAVYSLLLAAVMSALVVGLARRSELLITVARIPTAELYSEVPDGRIANRFTLQISNRASEQHTFTVRSLTEGAEFAIPGLPSQIPLGEESRLPGFVTAPVERFQGGRLPIRLEVVRDDGLAEEAQITMLGPGT